jgi:hypothetical protein
VIDGAAEGGLIVNVGVRPSSNLDLILDNVETI